VPEQVTGELKLSLKDLAQPLRVKFVGDLADSAVLYMVKFSRVEKRENDLRLMRGVTVTEVA